MKCVIMYKQGKFKFKYAGLKFEVQATENLMNIFDILASLIMLAEIKEKDGESVEWQALKNEVERACKIR